MINLLYHLQSLKWILPAWMMLGSSPTFVSMWWAWRIVSSPLSTHVYERGDEALYNLYQKLILFFYENYTGLEVVLYGDINEIMERKENVILMCNHQSTVDWIVADMLAERQGSLGNIRYILKDGLKYFPVYGFYFRQHSCIYINKSGKFKQDKTIKHLQMISQNKTPFWMVVYPEGTRYNLDLPDVISQSKEFAAKQGFEVLEHTLTPRVKATQLCISHLGEAADAIYDVTIAYGNTLSQDELGHSHRVSSPGLAEFVEGGCKQLHLHVSRIPMSSVPREEEEVKKWLHGRFHMKDRLLKRFYSSDPSICGTLGDNGKINKLGCRYTLPVFLMWATIHLPLWGTGEGRAIYWRGCVIAITAGWLVCLRY